MRAQRIVAELAALIALALPGARDVTQAQAGTVPPPVEQQTADCRAPVFATDQLVCADPALRALDGELDALLASVRQPSSRWSEPQWQWFQRRSRCAFAEDHRACADAAYRERIVLLRPLDPKMRQQTARCSDPEIVAIAVTGNEVFLMDRVGGVRGVAVQGRGSGGWQPFLAIIRRGEKLTMRTAEGFALHCLLGGR